MIENGTIEVQELNINAVKDRVYKVKYDHKKAIEGIKDNEMACTVIVDIPNTYLKSFLDFFNAEGFRFACRGITNANEDRINLNKTNAIVVSYIFKDINKYLKKVLIKDQQEFTVVKSGTNLTFLKGEI